jgi:hypothetical protein
MHSQQIIFTAISLPTEIWYSGSQTASRSRVSTLRQQAGRESLTEGRNEIAAAATLDLFELHQLFQAHPKNAWLVMPQSGGGFSKVAKLHFEFFLLLNVLTSPDCVAARSTFAYWMAPS